MAEEKRKAKRYKDSEPITNDVYMSFGEAMSKVVKADKDKVDKAVQELKKGKNESKNNI